MTVALGVDLKAGGYAIGAVEDGPRVLATQEWYARPPRSGERVQVIERLYRVDTVLRGVIRAWCEEYRPGAILIEDPKGRHRAPTLVAAYGAACAAVYAGVVAAGTSTTVFTEDARTWRRAAGCTSAKGEDPKAGALRLAREVGCPDGRSEDEMEAVAMAVRALKIGQKEDRS